MTDNSKLNLDGKVNNINLIAAVVLLLALPLSESIKNISLYAFILPVFLYNLYAGNIRIKMTSLHYGFLLFFLVSCVTALFARNTSEAIKGIHDVLRYTVTFFVFLGFYKKREINLLLWAFFISTGIAVIYGIYDSFYAHTALSVPALGHYNYTAMYLIISATVMLSMIVHGGKKNKLMTAVLFFLLSITLAASVMTTMRTSFIALALFIAVLLEGKKSTSKHILIIFLFVVMLFTALYFYKPMWDKLLSTTSLTYRIEIWKFALTEFKGNFLTGVGLNNFRFTLPVWMDGGRIVCDAHSLYLNTAAQTGIFGLTSLMLIIYGFMKTWRLFDAVSGYEKTVKYGAMGAFLVIFASGFLDTTLHHKQAMEFAILSALMAACSSRT
ncbi:MAG: O-antigen ligase family protein [Nitrospirae bacterium]|nr:O-antigen ligase family protein [Nitrospirota bacterium]MBF0534556.1 O-antigen ligase family protein [Nitrospirota bacterium]MBF0617591.1 O-antigen ligase family protein [Nitrospirota bacterium]